MVRFEAGKGRRGGGDVVRGWPQATEVIMVQVQRPREATRRRDGGPQTQVLKVTHITMKGSRD